jgi:hypothetical protein
MESPKYVVYILVVGLFVCFGFLLFLPHQHFVFHNTIFPRKSNLAIFHCLLISVELLVFDIGD